MHAQSLLLCLTLCDPMDCSLPGSSVYGILQARIVEWMTMPFSRGSSPPRDQTLGLLHLLHLHRRILYGWATGDAQPQYCKVIILQIKKKNVNVASKHVYFKPMASWVTDFRVQSPASLLWFFVWAPSSCKLSFLHPMPQFIYILRKQKSSHVP